MFYVYLHYVLLVAVAMKSMNVRTSITNYTVRVGFARKKLVLRIAYIVLRDYRGK